MNDKLALDWLTLLCQMIPNVHRALAVFGADDDALALSWPAGSQASDDLHAAARRAFAQEAPLTQTSSDGPASATSLVASALLRDGRPDGAVAVEVKGLPEAQRAVVMQLLQWGGAWLGLLRRDASDAQPATLGKDIIAATLTQRDFTAAAHAAVAALARALDCERVSLGLSHGRQLRVQALSSTMHFERKTELLRHIEAAMEEAVDHDAALVYPPLDGAGGVPRAHARLAQGEHQEALCSLPLKNAGRGIGALTLERRAERPFDADDVQRISAVAGLLGPLLDLKHRDEQGWLSRGRDALADWGRRLFGPAHLRSKAVALFASVLLAVLIFAEGEYRITASATLESTVQRALVAPIDGFLSTAQVRASALVKEGDVLATLDDRELRLEQRKWRGQRHELTNQQGRALAKLDRVELNIVRAQLAQAEAQLALLDEQLVRTRIVAPFDGIVVSGDLSQSFGAPVERGQILFEVAPLDAYRVALDVEEGDILAVGAGLHGHLALAAAPNAPLGLVVEKITGVSEIRDGRNVFRVEARLEKALTHLRPGMKGVGKIDAGQRRLIWLWTHGLLDRARLWLWTWWP